MNPSTTPNARWLDGAFRADRICMELALHGGADPYVRDNDGRNAVWHVIHGFSSNNASNEPQTFEEERIALLRWLRELGVSFGPQGHVDAHPLIAFLERGRDSFGLLNTLLENGAGDEPDLQRTALDVVLDQAEQHPLRSPYSTLQLCFQLIDEGQNPALASLGRETTPGERMRRLAQEKAPRNLREVEEMLALALKSRLNTTVLDGAPRNTSHLRL